MKKGWEVKRLGDVIEIKNGRNQQVVLDELGKYKILGSAGNVMGYANDYICEAGTTIIGRKGNISKPIYIDEPFWNVDTAFGLYPKNENNLSKRFVYYLCLCIDFKSMNRGTTIPSLVKSELQTIQISFPKSIEEQQRMVAILDKAFDEIEKVKKLTEQNLKNAKELFESYLQGVFENKGEDWEEKALGECFKLKSGENITAKMMVENGEYPVYGGNGIAGRYNKYNLSGSNVIVGRVGALCGNVRHIEESIWLTDNGFKITDYNFEFDNAFLTYLLNYKKLRSYARQAAQPVISNSSLEGVLLSFPKPLQEQQSIVKKLDKLSAKTKRLETIYQQKLDSLEELKKSILQKAFQGEL